MWWFLGVALGGQVGVDGGVADLEVAVSEDGVRVEGAMWLAVTDEGGEGRWCGFTGDLTTCTATWERKRPVSLAGGTWRGAVVGQVLQVQIAGAVIRLPEATPDTVHPFTDRRIHGLLIGEAAGWRDLAAGGAWGPPVPLVFRVDGPPFLRLDVAVPDDAASEVGDAATAGGRWRVPEVAWEALPTEVAVEVDAWTFDRWRCAAVKRLGDSARTRDMPVAALTAWLDEAGGRCGTDETSVVKTAWCEGGLVTGRWCAERTGAGRSGAPDGRTAQADLEEIRWERRVPMYMPRSARTPSEEQRFACRAVVSLLPSGVVEGVVVEECPAEYAAVVRKVIVQWRAAPIPVEEGVARVQVVLPQTFFWFR